MAIVARVDEVRPIDVAESDKQVEYRKDEADGASSLYARGEGGGNKGGGNKGGGIEGGIAASFWTRMSC